MLQRKLEPELMEDEQQVVAYSRANFQDSNLAFINFILQNHHHSIHRLLDIGCGPADLTIELARQISNLKITAIDGSAQMIKLAEQHVSQSGLNDRISIKQDKLPGLDISEDSFDVIIAKDILHHIPEPSDFWSELERIANQKTTTYVMDLIRPNSMQKVENLVSTVTPNEAEVLKTDFYNSLLAAFTLEEVTQQLSKTIFEFELQPVGKRHFVAKCWRED